jgi:hypothetical protein
MQVTIPHKFTKDEAMSRVKLALTDAKKKLEGQGSIDEERWEGDTLHFAVSGQGQNISGTLTVTDKEFDLYAKLPLMLKLFEGRIEAAIKEQAGKMLG